MDKSPEAFRTISEVAEVLETPAHVLRFWETRFPQIRPVKRAGGRRYYRPSDVALLTGIKRLLHEDGLTIRGVQKILREQGIRHVSGLAEDTSPEQEALEEAMAGRYDLEADPAVSEEEAAEATALALAAALRQVAAGGRPPAEDNVIAFPRDPNVPDSENTGLHPAQSVFPGFEPDPADLALSGAPVVESLTEDLEEPPRDDTGAADAAATFARLPPDHEDILPESEEAAEPVPEAPFIEAPYIEVDAEPATLAHFPRSETPPPAVPRTAPPFPGWVPLALRDLAPHAPVTDSVPAAESGDAESGGADAATAAAAPPTESPSDESKADQTLAARLRALPRGGFGARTGEIARLAQALKALHDRMDRPRPSH